MKKSSTVIRWIGVAVFGIMAISSLCSGGFLSTLLFLLGGFIIAPLDFVRNLRSKFKLNKTLSIVLAVILLFAGSLTMPTSEEPTDNVGGSQISGTVSEVSSNTDEISSETTSKIEDVSSEEETVSKTESSSKPEEVSSKVESSSKPSETQSAPCSHTETTIKNKSNATCTDDGYSGDTYCTSCNEVIKNGSQIKATGHNTEIRNQKNATTTSEGYTGDTYCKTCGVKTATGNAIPKIVDNTQQDTNSETVYVTETGTKYHSTKSCPGLSRAKAIYDSTLSRAKSNGLTACSKCH